MNNRAANQFTFLNASTSPMQGEKWHDIIFIDGAAGSVSYTLPTEDETNIKNGHTITFINIRGTIDPINVFRILPSPNNYPILNQTGQIIQYSPFVYSLMYVNTVWYPVNLLTTTRMVDLQIHDTSTAAALAVGIGRFPVVIPKEYHGWYIENISYVLAVAGGGLGNNTIQLNINGILPVPGSSVAMSAGVSQAQVTNVRQIVQQYDKIYTQVTGITAVPGQGLYGVLTLSQV